jgi:hypothetical protein
VDWLPGHRLLQRGVRDQKTLDLLASPPMAAARDQRHRRPARRPRFVEGRRQFVWSSQRTGHKHLYLYDYDGALVRPLTAGEWDAWALPEGRGVDAGRGLVYFTASERSALERHLYVARLDSATPSQPRRLTVDGDGWNGVWMSQDSRSYLRSYSDPGQPARWSLHDVPGRRLAWLVENRLDAGHPYATYLDRHANGYGSPRRRRHDVDHDVLPAASIPVAPSVYRHRLRRSCAECARADGRGSLSSAARATRRVVFCWTPRQGRAAIASKACCTQLGAEVEDQPMAEYPVRRPSIRSASVCSAELYGYADARSEGQWRVQAASRARHRLAAHDRTHRAAPKP